MVYDCIGSNSPERDKRGYSIFSSDETGVLTYEIYTDDGRGNGDYVCSATDLFYARLVAELLDANRLAGVGAGR